MYTAIQSAIAVDFTLYKIKLLLLLLLTCEQVERREYDNKDVRKDTDGNTEDRERTRVIQM